MNLPKKTLAIAAALPLFVAGYQPEELVDICSRTPQVREAIFHEIETHTGSLMPCNRVLLSRLHAVEVLSLRRNYPAGEIRAEDFERLANLEVLNLQANGLSGPIPPELGNLSNLKGLYLGGNELSGPIPAELGKLTNLEELDLHDNELSGPIPPWLGDLVKLDWLNLEGNRLNIPMPSSLHDQRALPQPN